MARGRRAPIVFAAGGALALLAAGAIVSRSRVDGGEPSSARVDATASAVREAPVPVAGVELDAQRTEVAGAEPSNATVADDVKDAAADAAQIERAVDKSLAALAENLGGAEWSRASWDAALGATAGSLPDGAALRLCEVFHDGTRPITERLVAAELLHKFGSARGALTDGGTIDELRRLTLGSQADGRASLAAAATRALAWLGDDVDRARLLDVVCGSISEEERASATWALAAAPADRLLPALCDRLAPGRDARATELALVTLDAVLRRPPDADTGELSPAQAHASDAALASLLSDAKTPPRVRQRALVVCAALAERSDVSHAAALLASCVDDPAAPSDLRLRAAESLLRIGSNFRAAERKTALDHLLAVARDVQGASAADRRRAWSALIGLQTHAAPDDATTADVAAQLSSLSDAETDATVRATIARSSQRASSTK
jgi:hypothetical protein